MEKKMTIVACVLLLLLPGCAPGTKYFNEAAETRGSRASLVASLPTERNGPPGKIDNLRRNVGILSTGYIESYNQYQKANFGANAILLSIGLTGLGITAFNPSIDLLKGLAIGAGSTAAIQNFTITGKPEAFLKANQSLVCVQDSLGELNNLHTTLPATKPDAIYLFQENVLKLAGSGVPDIETVYQKGLISNNILRNAPNQIIETVDKIVYRSMTEFWTTKSTTDLINEAKTNIEGAMIRKIESKIASDSAKQPEKIASGIDYIAISKNVSDDIALITNYEIKLASCLLIQ